MLLQSFFNICLSPTSRMPAILLENSGRRVTFPSLIILCSTVISLDHLCSQCNLEICSLPIPSILYWEVNKYTTITCTYTRPSPSRDWGETGSRFEGLQQWQLRILFVSNSASLLSKEIILSGRRLQIKKLNFPLQNQ